MLATDADPADLAGIEVVDQRGDRLGRVRQVYLDGARLGWVAVRGNVLGTQEALVPLDGAVLEDDTLAVPVSRSTVLAAPRRPVDRPLEDDEREAMHAFYEAPRSEEPADPPVDSAAPAPAESPSPTAVPAADSAPAPTAAVAEPGAEELTVTAYRERMRMSTERVPTTRLRLTKTVVIEQETATVSLRREEVRLVREPVVDGSAVPGATVGSAEQEVVLHEERVVVETEVVPIERVRLVVQTIAEDHEVSAEVRAERIELLQEPGSAS